MEYSVAMTYVIDRERAIRAREMHRIATAGKHRSGLLEGVVARVSRLINVRSQVPATFTECGGAPA